jgi:uncharacterized protein
VETKPDNVHRSPAAALLYGAPIGLLGGLIGLGGAEFRLPVLAGVFGYAARRAVALNLAISLIMVVSALLIRGETQSRGRFVRSRRRRVDPTLRRPGS